MMHVDLHASVIVSHQGFSRISPALASAFFTAAMLGMPATFATAMYVAVRTTILPSKVWPLALGRAHAADPVPTLGEYLSTAPGALSVFRLENTRSRSFAN